MRLERFRWVLLILTLGGIGLTLGKLWGLPHLDHKKPMIALPEKAPLSHWQFIQSSSLKPPQEATLQRGAYYSVLGARKYYYRQNNQLLDIELWFMNNTNGDVQRFASLYSSPSIQLAQVQKGEMHYVAGSGYYLHFVAGDRTYWSSCTSAKGESTVTISQFTQKGFQQNLNLERLLTWLLENRSLLDRQCVWSNFSVPSINFKSQNNSKEKITKTWTEWTKWWQNSRILKS